MPWEEAAGVLRAGAALESRLYQIPNLSRGRYHEADPQPGPPRQPKVESEQHRDERAGDQAACGPFDRLVGTHLWPQSRSSHLASYKEGPRVGGPRNKDGKQQGEQADGAQPYEMSHKESRVGDRGQRGAKRRQPLSTRSRPQCVQCHQRYGGRSHETHGDAPLTWGVSSHNVCVCHQPTCHEGGDPAERE